MYHVMGYDARERHVCIVAVSIPQQATRFFFSNHRNIHTKFNTQRMCHKICGTCKFEDSACSSLLCFLNRPQDMIGVVNRNSLYYNFKIERFSIFLPCFIPWRSFRFAGRGKSGFSFFFLCCLPQETSETMLEIWHSLSQPCQCRSVQLAAFV